MEISDSITSIEPFDKKQGIGTYSYCVEIQLIGAGDDANDATKRKSSGSSELTAAFGS